MCIRQPFSCRYVRRNCQESYFRKAIICPKMPLSDGRLFAAHGRICKFYPSLAPLHEGSFGPLHTQRGLLKPHFGNAKDGSNGTFGVPYRSDFRFGRRRPLFSSSSHANHFSAAGSYSPVRTISRAFPEFHRIRYADLRPWHVPVYRSTHPACGCADRPDNKLRNRKHVKKTPC